MKKQINEQVLSVISLISKLDIKLESVETHTYCNMVATIADAILQAGMNYEKVVYPRIKYILQTFKEYKTTCDFLILMQCLPLEEIIHLKNKRKQKTIIDLTWYLYGKRIETENDLSNWFNSSNKESELIEIFGIGNKTVDYLKLLSGNQAIPIDRHVYKLLNMANVNAKCYHNASRIMKAVANNIGISERTLDRSVWNYFSLHYCE